MSRDSAVSAADAANLAINGADPVSDRQVPIVSVRLEEADIEAATNALRSGMLAQGKNVAELEAEFARHSGARHAIACANGTCALQLVYEPLFNAGDEVLVPAWSYIATVSMVVARGAKPIFVDADPNTCNFDADDARKRITPKTKAIAATHLYGNPVDIAAVEALAKEHDLKVIYDAAQAHLACYEGKGLGVFGDAVTYSFYPTKNMTTGEGGLITTNDDDLAEKIRRLRSHGEARKYIHDTIGYNYRMTDVEAAIGVSQLSRLPELTKKRRENACRLDGILAGVEGISPPRPTDNAEHVYHLYGASMDLDAFRCDRDAFIDALRAEGVGVAVHYPRSLTRQPVFEPMVAEHPPVSDRLAKTLFCLPVHPALTDQDFEIIEEALNKVAAAMRS